MFWLFTNAFTQIAVLLVVFIISILIIVFTSMGKAKLTLFDSDALSGFILISLGVIGIIQTIYYGVNIYRLSVIFRLIDSN